MTQLPDVNQMAQNATRPVVADGDFPDTVKLTQPGEYVYGQVTAIRDANTQYGNKTVLEVADQQRGTVSMWISNVQLVAGLIEGNNQLSRPVQRGDVVYVRFDGKQQLDGGRTVSNFSINLAAGPQPQQAPAQVAPPQQQPAPQQQWQQPAPQQWNGQPQQQPAPQPQPTQQQPQNVPF